MKIAITCLLLLSLGSCTSTGLPRTKSILVACDQPAFQPASVEAVRVSAVLADPAAFHGRTVGVFGFPLALYDRILLFATLKDLNRKDPGYAIAATLPKCIEPKAIEELMTGLPVTVVGTYDASMQLGRTRGLVDPVDAVLRTQ